MRSGCQELQGWARQRWSWVCTAHACCGEGARVEGLHTPPPAHHPPTTPTTPATHTHKSAPLRPGRTRGSSGPRPGAASVKSAWQGLRQGEEGATGKRGGSELCASRDTKDAQRGPLQQIPGWPLGRLAPAVGSRWGPEGQLVQDEALQPVRGQGCEGPEPRSPRWPGSRPEKPRNAASFSASRSSAMT